MNTKKINIKLLAVMGFMLIGGLSAFTMSENNKKATEPVKEEIQHVEAIKKVVLSPWSFNGNSNTEVTDPTQYSPIIGTPPSCSGIVQTVCYIEAPDDGAGKPDLNQHIDPEDPESPTYADLIQEALAFGMANNVVKDFRAL